jgi:hypothetical protein
MRQEQQPFNPVPSPSPSPTGPQYMAGIRASPQTHTCGTTIRVRLGELRARADMVDTVRDQTSIPFDQSWRSKVVRLKGGEFSRFSLEATSYRCHCICAARAALAGALTLRTRLSSWRRTDERVSKYRPTSRDSPSASGHPAAAEPQPVKKILQSFTSTERHDPGEHPTRWFPVSSPRFGLTQDTYAKSSSGSNLDTHRDRAASSPARTSPPRSAAPSSVPPRPAHPSPCRIDENQKRW